MTLFPEQWECALCMPRTLQDLLRSSCSQGSMQRMFVQPLTSLTSKSPGVGPEDIFPHFPNLICPKNSPPMATTAGLLILSRPGQDLGSPQGLLSKTSLMTPL
jgi:hypothetical protein